MDSTLIQCEVIDELAKKAGVGKQVCLVLYWYCLCFASINTSKAQVILGKQVGVGYVAHATPSDIG
jgi:hypothetical protein